MALINVSGKLKLLRVHEVGSAFGPPTDRIDVEVVFQLDTNPDRFFGFQLRDDARLPAHQGMLDLLRDGFNFGWVVNSDVELPSGKRNGTAVRVWLTKPKTVPPGRVIDAGGAVFQP